ncbi:hypothetical protein B7991_11835, partial [Fibrobacter sp. UWB3]
MTRKASAARMSILILIAEPQLSSPVRGMTTEPSDAETCLHVSISEANKSGHVRGMTEQVRHDSAPALIRGSGGRHKKEKAPPDVLRQAGRESS